MDGLLIVGMIIGFLIGLMFSVDTRVERNRCRSFVAQKTKQIFCSSLRNTNMCERLAKKLEIEADGGDSPADFIRQAITELWEEVDEEIY